MAGKRKSNRRDFLKGKSLVRELSALGETLPEPEFSSAIPSASQASRAENYLQHFAKNAMACEFEVFFNFGQYESAGDSAMQAFQLLDQLESQLSIYKEESELSQINRTAAQADVRVEQNLFDLLEISMRLHAETQGAFDITAGVLSRIWGFEKRQGEVPEAHDISSALETVGMENVVLNRNDSTVRFKNKTLTLNLGGIGKGYAIDQAVKKLITNGVMDFVIHGGQSSVSARGKNLGIKSLDAKSCEGWRVGLSHPVTPDRRLAEIVLRDESLGTSGTGRQGFFHQGKRYGHIIDPRTGWPTEHILSSTVISDSAARSDALATAFFVMQVSEVEEYCRNHVDLKAVLVVPTSQSGVIELVSFNMDESDWIRC